MEHSDFPKEVEKYDLICLYTLPLNPKQWNICIPDGITPTVLDFFL